jgi:transcriptional regulator of acetoin/glycerol metabolism
MDGDLITAEAARRALPNGHLAGARAQVPLFYHENDSLEAFLDRTLLTLYEQLLATTGNHSQAARLLRIDRTSLYQRLERARRRTQNSGSP